MKTYNYYKNIILKFSGYLKDLVEEEVVIRHYEKLCQILDTENEANPNKDNWLNSELRKQLETFERYELIVSLKKEIEEYPNDKLKAYHYFPLMNYLTLTCFDQLGQREHSKYENWIGSKKNKVRDEYLELIKDHHSLKILRLSHKKYLEIHGTKNNFTNFFLNVLRPNHAKLIFENLIITSDYTTSNMVSIDKYEGDLSDNDKINYLYSLRNNYTHSMRSSFSTLPIISSDTNSSNYHLYDSIFKDKKKYGILKSNKFDEILLKSVLIGLSQLIIRENELS